MTIVISVSEIYKAANEQKSKQFAKYTNQLANLFLKCQAWHYVEYSYVS
jgi:hypothetical protein